MIAQFGLEDEITHEDDTSRVVATYVPLGVVGAICPWNFPLILSSLKMLSALVTGNCVIIKTSPFTPYTVLRAVELWAPLLPRHGVLQAVNGGADLGAALTAHPGIAKITFTGTIATGKRVMAACAKTLKRVTLELSGNDAAVVCPDADLDLAATQTATGAFFNAGQVCVATKRVYVHESVYDEFLKKFLAETRKTWGISKDAGKPSLFGPLSNQTQFHTLNSVLEDIRARGANIVEGGQKYEGKGFWLSPTVVDQPPEDSLLVQEEQFGESQGAFDPKLPQSCADAPQGPVIPILKWSSEDDVIRRANLDNAGLGASVFSKNQENAERVARRLEAGSVWINSSERPNPSVYFGGVKDSGFGGEMGRQGLFSYCYIKCLHFSKL